MHSMAFTAVEVAKSAHVPSRELAKTVIIKVNNELAMAVVPANYKVDLEILKQTLDTPQITLAEEAEFTPRFKDCEVGAMPPFGCLYDMDVYIAESLSEDDKITFNAGSHLEAIQMNYKDYENLVKPRFIFLDN
jgi:Ala-tRNA(Pro) deacylase